jgi:hypothetical protein
MCARYSRKHISLGIFFMRVFLNSAGSQTAAAAALRRGPHRLLRAARPGPPVTRACPSPLPLPLHAARAPPPQNSDANTRTTTNSCGCC